MQSLISRLGVLFFFMLASTNCTQRDQTELLRNGARPFQFNHEEVKSLTVMKSDPGSGQTWTAELRHVGPEKIDWEIVSAPFTLGDRRAHGTFIVHLLDTFRTLGVEAPAPRGPLGSFGLEPPRFGFRWMNSDLRIGNPQPHGMAYAQFLPRTEVYTIKGAAIQMLEHIPDFQALRLQTLATFTADDVEEIELKQGKRSFYAQRNGDVWADARNRPIRKDVAKLIESLTHWRIARFLDEEEDVEQARKAQSGRPAVEITVKNLQGQPTTIRFTAGPGDAVLGEISSRKNSLFQLYPQIAKKVLSYL